VSISVVYAAETGHVLGALAVTGGTPPADVASLVGTSIPVRMTLPAGEVAVFSFTERQLGAGVVDDEADVFDDPFAFGVTLEDGTPEPKPKPTLARLASWEGGIVLSDRSLTVTVPVKDTSRATPVLALVSDGPVTKVLLNEIPVNSDHVELPVTVDSGGHGILVLAAGWAGRLESVTT
jgi:hypothetical protein